MNELLNIALIPLLPLAGFLFIGLVGRKFFPTLCGHLGTTVLFISFILSVIAAKNYFFDYGMVNGVYIPHRVLDFEWLTFAPGFSIDMSIVLDPISVMMLLVVTFVSTLVHLFSMGYMKGENRYAVYFSFLSLFTFSMLGLVLSANIFQIYIFWELVGVSSFLLIGFYYDKPAAVAASKKAFIVTRFADLGFLAGILILSYYTQTFDFHTMIQRALSPEFSVPLSSASFLGASAFTWGLMLIFVGGAGKSAMFPLHIWLPDAMEGPTPVSALIHAATMVVAGVYLVARLFPLYALGSPVTLEIISWIGIVTALFAAIVACTQTDIKRVLAYSTISQIAFMVFALGVSGYGGEAGTGYTASMFHLFTHAFFKALLFLGAGAVIHFVHSNDFSAMGGLRKFMPVTHITFLIACLAIAGIPPLSGFFSKEEIMLAAWQGNKIIYGIALLTAGLTAFYMFRLYFNIFWNKPYHQHDSHHHGEGGVTMMLPLVLLAIITLGCGFIPFGHFISSDGHPHHGEFHILFSIAPVLVAVAGILIALVIYKKQSAKADQLTHALKGLYKLSYHKFYMDELWLFITKKIIFNLISKPAAWVDKYLVDGSINAIGSLTTRLSESVKKVQSGHVQDYAIYFLSATLALTLLLFCL